jgi:uncharacterized membrane protein YkgB
VRQWITEPVPNRDRLYSIDDQTENEVRRKAMSLGTILLIVLIVLLIGAVPTWPHSSGWGYGPSGLLGTVLLIVLILFLLGKI